MSTWQPLTRGAVRLLLTAGLAFGTGAPEPARAQTGAAVYLPWVQREPGRLSGHLSSVRTLAGSPDLLLVELNVIQGVETEGLDSVWLSRDGGGHWQRPATRPWIVTGRDFVTAARATWVASSAGPLLAVGQTFRSANGPVQVVLYTSPSDGVSWTPHPLPESPDCPDPRLNNLETTPARPERLYVVIGCHGVLGGTSSLEWIATSDGGETWQVVITPDRAGMQQLLSPAQPGRLFVVDIDRRVHRSDDDGAHWTVVGVAPNGRFTLAASVPDRLLVATSYGPLISTDNAATWRALAPIPCLLHPDETATTVPGLPLRDLVRCTDGRLIATSDAGVTWLALPPEPWSASRRLQLFLDQAVEGRLWVITGGGEWDGLWRLDPEPGSAWTLVLIATARRDG